MNATCPLLCRGSPDSNNPPIGGWTELPRTVLIKAQGTPCLPGHGLYAMEQWTCVFLSRAGAQAHAVFDSEERAKQFAERHAQAAATGVPLKWNDTNEATLLTTPVGNYWIVRTRIDAG